MQAQNQKTEKELLPLQPMGLRPVEVRAASEGPISPTSRRFNPVESTLLFWLRVEAILQHWSNSPYGTGERHANVSGT